MKYPQNISKIHSQDFYMHEDGQRKIIAPGKEV